MFAADDAVFADAPLGYHLHSILWYAIAVAIMAALCWRLFPGASAVLAALVFAWSHAHVLPYGWVSARHVLVGGAFALAAIWARVRWRSDGWRPGRWLAPVALAAGLAGSEGALAGVVYWVAYEIAGPEGRDWKRRLWGASPALAVACAYLCIYRMAGGGVVASGGYHDPVSDPLAFAAVAVTRLPALLGDALLGVPAELANLWPAGPLVAIGLGGALLLAIGYVCCRPALAAHERAALRWLVLGALGSTLIGVSGFPGGRVLFLPNLGFAALIGILVRAGLTRAAGVAGIRRGLGIAIAAILAVAHLVLAPISSLRVTARTARRARATDAVAASIAAEAPASGRAYLLSASDPLVFLYPRAVLAATAPGRNPLPVGILGRGVVAPLAPHRQSDVRAGDARSAAARRFVRHAVPRLGSPVRGGRDRALMRGDDPGGGDDTGQAGPPGHRAPGVAGLGRCGDPRLARGEDRAVCAAAHRGDGGPAVEPGAQVADRTVTRR